METPREAAQEAGATTAPLLEMRGISKSFGAMRALTDVSFAVRAGEVHALMGENGAGKSTLMKILSGAYQADPGGRILIRGQAVEIPAPQEARRHGIAVIYQELSLAPNLTVAENIFLGRELSRGGLVDRRAMEAAAEPVLKRLGLAVSPRTRVARLSLGERQLVEIARALQAHTRILVMDEPTTPLSTRETDRLFAIIAGLKAEGIAIVYISHRMEEVYALADRVSVLRDGALIGTLDQPEISAGRVVAMMVGRDLSSFYRKEHKPGVTERRELLAVRNLGDGGRVRGVSFDLRAGEVLGVAGLVGAGRTELARLIYGADRATHGEVLLEGRRLEIARPRAALDAGIAYLTEDRKALGLFLDMTIRDNVSIGVAGEDALPGGLTNFAAARRRAEGALRALSIRAPNAGVAAGALSGGNQQKVLLARLLETRPKVLLLDEPTRGVDIGAKSEIYRLIDELANAGVGIVVISSELPEIVGICDRVLVIREGRAAGEIAQPITQEAIIALATGAAAGARPAA